jgi:protease-4
MLPATVYSILQSPVFEATGATGDFHMWRFLRLLLALILSQIVIFFLLLALFLVVIATFPSVPDVQQESVLWVQLQGEIVEYPTLPRVPFLRRRPLSQSAILEALDMAERDDRVTAVVLDIDYPLIGWGKASELHQAILGFRQSGKPVLAYAPFLDEISLFVATACDSIFLPPTGKIYMNGIGVGPMYFKGTFDKLGVRPNFARIGEYKDAPETSLRRDMSPESRAQWSWLLDGIWVEFLETLSTSRNIGRADLEEALNLGLMQPDQAVDLGLIDGVRYREALLGELVEDTNDPRLVPLMGYHQGMAARAPRRGDAIAVVHTRGLILRGRNSYNPYVGTILGAASVVRDLEAAAADNDVAAVVLRIDSPGGEIIASDIISNAVERVQTRKPVVVSMVDVAASGGYMMSFRANRIVALPTTITGSIGAYTGKLNLRGLYGKIGVTRDFVTRGSFPFLFSDYHDWSAEEESLIVRRQREDYERWISGIAANRNLTPETVDRLGRGRVWTGLQAFEHGLVDALGGQELAIEVAKQIAGLAEDARPRIVHYPEERSFMDLLLEEGDLLWASLVESWAGSLTPPRDVSWGVLNFDLLR